MSVEKSILFKEVVSVIAGRNAISAKSHAVNFGLEFKLFPFPYVLEMVGEGEDPIQRCAQETGTEYNEQLRFALMSDASLDKGRILAVRQSF